MSATQANQVCPLSKIIGSLRVSTMKSRVLSTNLRIKFIVLPESKC